MGGVVVYGPPVPSLTQKTGVKERLRCLVACFNVYVLLFWKDNISDALEIIANTYK